MNEILTVLGAPLISAAAALGVSALQNRKSMSLIEYKIDELTKKVEKHNSVIERTFKLEERMSIAEAQIKDMKKG